VDLSSSSSHLLESGANIVDLMADYGTFCLIYLYVCYFGTITGSLVLHRHIKLPHLCIICIGHPQGELYEVNKDILRGLTVSFVNSVWSS